MRRGLAAGAAVPRIVRRRLQAGARAHAGIAAVDRGIEQFRQRRPDRLHVGSRCALDFGVLPGFLGVSGFFAIRRIWDESSQREKGKWPRDAVRPRRNLSAGVSKPNSEPPPFGLCPRPGSSPDGNAGPPLWRSSCGSGSPWPPQPSIWSGWHRVRAGHDQGIDRGVADEFGFDIRASAHLFDPVVAERMIVHDAQATGLRLGVRLDAPISCTRIKRLERIKQGVVNVGGESNVVLEVEVGVRGRAKNVSVPLTDALRRPLKCRQRNSLARWVKAIPARAVPRSTSVVRVRTTLMVSLAAAACRSSSSRRIRQRSRVSFSSLTPLLLMALLAELPGRLCTTMSGRWCQGRLRRLTPRGLRQGARRWRRIQQLAASGTRLSTLSAYFLLACRSAR